MTSYNFTSTPRAATTFFYIALVSPKPNKYGIYVLLVQQ